MDELVRRLTCLGHGCQLRCGPIGGSSVAKCDGETVSVRVGDLDLIRPEVIGAHLIVARGSAPQSVGHGCP